MSADCGHYNKTEAKVKGPGKMGLPIIQINNVTKSFETKDSRVEALKGISLEINRGDIYGIIGMSGAGKSTLVRCLNFLENLPKALC